MEPPRGRLVWRPASPHIYRVMHEAAYDAIKRTSPENEVLIGGLAPRGDPRPGTSNSMPPLRFVRELACVDGSLQPLGRRECRDFRPLRADGFAHHPYSYTGSPSQSDPAPDNASLADLGRLTALLGELHRLGRIAEPLPLYLSEYGYETKPPDPTGIPVEKQPEYLAEATYLAWRNPNVRMFSQFLLQDTGPNLNEPLGTIARWIDYQTGLLEWDGHRKPSYYGFRFPFWAQSVVDAAGTRQVFVFGQLRARPGQRHLEIQVLGPGGRWYAAPSLPALASGGAGCTAFTSDRSGFFQRLLPFIGNVTYRAVLYMPGRNPEASMPVTVGDPRPLDTQGTGGLLRPPQ